MDSKTVEITTRPHWDDVMERYETYLQEQSCYSYDEIQSLLRTVKHQPQQLNYIYDLMRKESKLVLHEMLLSWLQRIPDWKPSDFITVAGGDVNQIGEHFRKELSVDKFMSNPFLTIAPTNASCITQKWYCHFAIEPKYDEIHVIQYHPYSPMGDAFIIKFHRNES